MATSTSTGNASVKSLWKQWVAIVDLFVRQDMARHQVKAEDYRALHARLLKACKENSDAHLANFAQRAAEIASPWMSPESLHDAPQKILENLRTTCQLAEGKSTGVGQRSAGKRWLPVALFIALFAGAGLATLVVLDPSSAASWKASILNRSSQGEQRRKSSLWTDEGKPAFWVIIVAGGTVTALMAYSVFRSPKQT